MAKEIMSQPRQSSAKLCYSILSALRDSGGVLTKDEIIHEIRSKVFLNSWELGSYKNGKKRWLTILERISKKCVDAGMIKIWHSDWKLTERGHLALQFVPLELWTEVVNLTKNSEQISPKLRGTTKRKLYKPETKNSHTELEVQPTRTENIHNELSNKKSNPIIKLFGGIVFGIGLLLALSGFVAGCLALGPNDPNNPMGIEGLVGGALMFLGYFIIKRGN